MRKILLLSLFIVFVFAFSVHGAAYKDTIKVGLKFSQNAVNSVTVTSLSGVDVFDGAGELLGFYPSVVISRNGGVYVIDEKIQCNYDAITVIPKSNSIMIDGKEYRGSLLLSKNNDSTMNVINVVNIDQYLYSVLGKEMSPSFPIEALKAQAICARNYALCSVRHKDLGFDVCATTDCQTYGGVASESKETIRAVDETSGEVVLYGGNMVQLYFYTSDGGTTESCENVWSANLGYIKAIEDPYEDPAKATKYSWEEKLTYAQVGEKLAQKGINIGTVTDIIVEEVSEAGSVLRITFVGENGTYTAKKENCRIILSLPSQRYTVKKIGGGEIVFYSDKGQLPQDFSVITKDGITKKSGNYVISADGISQRISQQSGETYYQINGHGYGHRIGMSQWGAKGMAEQGFSYQDILNFYYNDIEIAYFETGV